MSEEMEHSENNFNSEDQEVNTVTQVDGMYESWFLDYASYVIFGLKTTSRANLDKRDSI